MPSISEIRKGARILLDNEPYLVVSFEFVKPGKGQALYRTKLKNLMSGAIIERTFRSGESFEFATLDHRNMQFLYKEGNQYQFMDVDNFEQMSLPEDVLGDAANYLLDNLTVEVVFFRGNAIGINIPSFVNMRVVDTDPYLRGDTSSSDLKLARVESGFEVRVPPFINEGDVIQIDTRSGQYVTRVNK